MSANDLVVTQLNMNTALFESFTKDYTDQDASVMPCPDSPHLNWILCHVATTEDWVMSTLSGQPMKLPEKVTSVYNGGSPCKADDGMTRAEAWKMFSETRARAVAFVKSYDMSRLNDPAPKGTPPMFPTIGSLVALIGGHAFWHFGQMTVTRRMLNKPKMF